MNLKMHVLRLIVLATTVLAPTAASALTDQERADAIVALPWVQEGTYKLPASNSSIALPEGYMLVLGEGARRFATLLDATDEPNVEAVVVNQDLDQIRFESFREDGYVSIDDWSELDPAPLLRTVSNNTENVNSKRRSEGLPELHVAGWLQQPALDRQTDMVFWAIELTEGDGRTVNSIALRLGRDGFEKLTWVVDRSKYRPVSGQLDVMLRAHSFDPGYRYADHQSGDKTALYGIAGLVAAVAGAKAVKVAAGAGLLVLLKKFGVFVFVAIGAVLYRLKNLFRRRPPPPPPADRLEPKV